MAISIDSIKKLSTSKKFLILMVMVFVIGGIYFYLFVLPEQEELSGLKSQLDKLVKELNESKRVTKDLKKFQEQVEQLNLELMNALTQLPNEKEIPEILKNISSIGKASNLEFSLFKPKVEEPQQFYARVPIELIVLGSYHNTGIFFDKISKLPRIINVVDFNMIKAKEVKEKVETGNVVRTSCLVNTYRFIEKKVEEKKSEKQEGALEQQEGVSKPPKK